jgi:hypothetical protein
MSTRRDFVRRCEIYGSGSYVHTYIRLEELNIDTVFSIKDFNITLIISVYENPSASATLTLTFLLKPEVRVNVFPQ